MSLLYSNDSIQYMPYGHRNWHISASLSLGCIYEHGCQLSPMQLTIFTQAWIQLIVNFNSRAWLNHYHIVATTHHCHYIVVSPNRQHYPLQSYSTVQSKLHRQWPMTPPSPLFEMTVALLQDPGQFTYHQLYYIVYGTQSVPTLDQV